MRWLLAALLLLAAACGGGVDGGLVVSTTPTPESAPLPPPPEDLVVPPAEAGKLAAERIRFTLMSAAGAPLPDTAYAWTTDEHSGWVFPAEGRTDDEGLIDAAWIPGFPGTGELGLTFTEDGEERTREFETVSVAPPNPPWSARALKLDSPLATGYSVDLTPLTEPPSTFYAAIDWNGGYGGLQRSGNLFDRQLQFSAWDSSGGTPPEVVEVADGVICKRFDHEGNGFQCGAAYPWAVGKTYRFETTVDPGAPGFSHVALHVTDLESGDRRHIGTFRANREPFDNEFFSFVEDFGRRSPTCLNQEVRSAAFRRARARTDAGWVPLVNATLDGLFDQDAANPGTPECANFELREHPAGIELLIGGTNVRDPHESVRVRIPE